MSERKQTPLCILCTVVERGSGQKVSRAFSHMGVQLHYRVSGTGTASSDLLNILGIGTSERDILISPASRGAAESVVDRLHREGMSIHAKGITFMLPLTAASAKIAGILTREAPAHAEEVKTMDKSSRQSLILISVDQGYTDAVMDTAKAAGARGGTVIRSHIMENEEHDSFGGPTFAGEREVIFIVASQGERNAIMENVDKVHGGESAAHAVLYALPIEQVAHIS